MALCGRDCHFSLAGMNFFIIFADYMSRRFTILSIVAVVCLVASNIFETKIFSAGPLTLTGGFLIFPISYILNDCITEIYGFKKARFVILMSFLMNAFFVGTAQIVRILPPETFWDGQAHFDYIFAADLRITLASMAAFFAGSLLNSLVMSRMKTLQGERGFGWRAILSSLAGESVDSLIFFPIAFWGVGFENLLRMMLTQIMLKTAYEVIVLPLTTLYVKHLRAVGED